MYDDDDGDDDGVTMVIMMFMMMMMMMMNMRSEKGESLSENVFFSTTLLKLDIETAMIIFEDI